MLTQIVVLYMAYTLGLPAWCRALMCIGLCINLIRIMCGIYKAGEKSKL